VRARTVAHEASRARCCACRKNAATSAAGTAPSKGALRTVVARLRLRRLRLRPLPSRGFGPAVNAYRTGTPASVGSRLPCTAAATSLSTTNVATSGRTCCAARSTMGRMCAQNPHASFLTMNTTAAGAPRRCTLCASEATSSGFPTVCMRLLAGMHDGFTDVGARKRARHGTLTPRTSARRAQTWTQSPMADECKDSGADRGDGVALEWRASGLTAVPLLVNCVRGVVPTVRVRFASDAFLWTCPKLWFSSLWKRKDILPNVSAVEEGVGPVWRLLLEFLVSGVDPESVGAADADADAAAWAHVAAVTALSADAAAPPSREVLLSRVARGAVVFVCAHRGWAREVAVCWTPDFGLACAVVERGALVPGPTGVQAWRVPGVLSWDVCPVRPVRAAAAAVEACMVDISAEQALLVTFAAHVANTSSGAPENQKSVAGLRQRLCDRLDLWDEGAAHAGATAVLRVYGAVPGPVHARPGPADTKAAGKGGKAHKPGNWMDPAAAAFGRPAACRAACAAVLAPGLSPAYWEAALAAAGSVHGVLADFCRSTTWFKADVVAPAVDMVPWMAAVVEAVGLARVSQSRSAEDVRNAAFAAAFPDGVCVGPSPEHAASGGGDGASYPCSRKRARTDRGDRQERANPRADDDEDDGADANEPRKATRECGGGRHGSSEEVGIVDAGANSGVAQRDIAASIRSIHARVRAAVVDVRERFERVSSALRVAAAM
jgi:hypothetical protein